MTPLISSSAVNFAAIDFVSTDTAALASHMSTCADKRSRFFNLHAALELAHTVVFSRMVTVALLTGGTLALVGIVFEM